MTKQRTAVPRLLDQHEISALTRLSASRIRQLVASGEFPKPMRATNAKTGKNLWPADAIEAWIRERVAASLAKPEAA